MDLTHKQHRDAEKAVVEHARRRRRLQLIGKRHDAEPVLRARERRATADRDAKYISAGQYLVVSSEDPAYAGMRRNVLRSIRTRLTAQAKDTVATEHPGWSRRSRDFGRAVKAEVARLAKDAGIDPKLVS